MGRTAPPVIADVRWPSADGTISTDCQNIGVCSFTVDAASRCAPASCRPAERVR
jgi:hypothetical protein